MAECNKCRQSIRGETGIQCMGVCNKVFHTANRCCGMDQYSSKILEANNFIRFVCDDCMQYIHNVDMVLKEIQDNVNKNKQSLVDYKHEFESSLQQNESEIKQLLEAIEKRYEERMKKMEKLQKSSENNIDEIRKLFKNVNEFENKNKQLCKSLEEKNVDMCNEIKKVLKETTKKQTKMSYAESVKKKRVIPDANKQVPLIIKPKEKQTVDKTKEELNKVDPINLKITSVENRRNGTIVIQSENSDEREKIKNAIQNELTDRYEIKVPNPIELKLKITDMTFDHEKNEIIEKLKKQNPSIYDANLKIIEKYQVKRNNKTIYGVKLTVDNEAYTKMIEAGKVNIGWERCRVFDGTEIKQCLKCRGYNHIAKECRNQEICLRCHGQHKTKECNNKEQIVKCINCMKMNNKLNMDLDENHYTNDRQCPVYQNKLNVKMRRIGLAV